MADEIEEKSIQLTDMQERFCEEYLIDLNATQAALRAGYTENNPSQMAYQLLQKPSVAARITELKKRRSEKVQVTADFVITRLMEIADFDLADCYDSEGRLKNIHDIPLNARRALAGIKIFEEFDGFGRDRVKVGETREVKIQSKDKSLELLGKHLKLYTDKVEHGISNDLAERLARARKNSEQSDGE